VVHISSSSRGVTRRGFLTVAVSAIVAGVVAGVGAYYAGTLAAPVKEVTKTLEQTVRETVTRTVTTTLAPGAPVTTTVTTTVPVTTTVTAPPTTVTVTKTITMEEEVEKEKKTLYEAAKKEGELMVYNSLSVELNQRLMDKFSEQYPGIKTGFIRGAAYDIVGRITTEFERGVASADVVFTMDVVVDEEIMSNPERKTKMVKPYLPLGVIKDFPKEYYDPNGYWIRCGLTLFPIVYNTMFVKPEDAPKSYSDLIKPIFKGKITWTDLRHPTTIRVLSLFEKLYGRSFIDALAKQGIIFGGDTATVPLTRVAKGEAWVYVCPAVVVWGPIARGEPVAIARHVDRVYLAVTDWMFLLSNAPHPNAGKLYMSFLTSPEGQALCQEAGTYQPTNPKTPIVKPEYYIKDPVIHWLPSFAPGEYEAKLKYYQDIFK